MPDDPSAYLEGRYDLAAEIMALCETELGSYISKGQFIKRVIAICDRLPTGCGNG